MSLRRPRRDPVGEAFTSAGEHASEKQDGEIAGNAHALGGHAEHLCQVKRAMEMCLYGEDAIKGRAQPLAHHVTAEGLARLEY